MIRQLRWWRAALLILPLLGTGCRCGHERAIRDRDEAAPTMAQKGAGMAAKEEDAGVETWEPSLYLLPESSLEVVDEVEEVTPPRASADELWVVARRDTPVPAPPAARLGAAAEGEKSLSRERSATRPVSISALVTGFVASVDIRHTLMNVTPDTAAFVYELPLPEDASVRDFTVTIGPRTIRGVIREREEALSIYHLARQRGLVASLIDLDRTASLRNAIDNVPPGRTVELSFSYCAALPYLDNGFELRIPLSLRATTSPRSGGTGAGIAMEPGSGGENLPVALSVDVNMGIPLSEVGSSTHQVSVERLARERARVVVAGPITTGDPVFVLRCGVAGPDITAGVFAHRDPTGDYVSVCLVPPSATAVLPRRPLELLFLLDCSESMRGMHIFTAKQLVEAGLAELDSLDTFAIATFGGRLLNRGCLPVSAAYVSRAIDMVRSLPPDEGEGLEAGLRAALSLPHEEGRLRVVLLLTDGYVDDPFGTILPLVAADQEARVFIVCTGTAVNKLLLEAMAVEGRGGIVYVRPGATPDEVIPRLWRALSRPVLTGITVEMKGCADVELMPRRIPDLLAGRPVTMIARCTPSAGARLSITGMGRKGLWSAEHPLPPMQSSNPAIATVWARRQLSDLVRQALADTSAPLDATIRAHAMEHGLLSPYTSFLTIDTAG